MANLSSITLLKTEVDSSKLSAKSSYMDKDSIFGDVLDKVNNSYRANESTSKNNEKSQVVDKSFSNKNSQKIEKKSSSNGDSKYETRVDKESDSKNVEEKRSTSESSSKMAEKTDGEAQTVEQSKVESSNEVDSNSSEKTETDSSQGDNLEQDSTSASQENEQEVVAVDADTIVDGLLNEMMASAVEKSVGDLALTVNQPVTNELQQQEMSLVDRIQVPKDANAQIPVNDVQLNVNTENLTKDAKISKENTNMQPKVQPQSEQVKFNVQQDEVALQGSETVQTELKAQTSTNQTQAQQTPVIQAVNDAVVNSEVKPTDKLTGMKEALDKANVTQEAVTSMNTVVTSVGTSTGQQNNGSMMNNNAQEQAVKIAIENVSGSNGLSSTQGDSTVKTEFAKTLDNAQQPKELNKNDIMSQVYNKLETLKDSGETKVTMILKPENLGKLNLELVNGKEGLTAMITAENSQVKDLLDKSLEALKNSLSSQGVSVNNVSVKVAEPEKMAGEMFEFDQQADANLSDSSFSNDSNSTDGDSEFANDFLNATLSESENSEIETSDNLSDETTQKEFTTTVDYRV